MIIAVTGIKGGCGKTTLAINIATEWTQRGRDILLVDSDHQGTIRTWASRAEKNGHKVPTVVAVGDHLRRDIPSLAEKFDHTVIDSPPSDSAISRAALTVADLALLPTKATPSDVWVLEQSVALIRDAQKVNHQLRAVIGITMTIPRTVLSTRIREVLGDLGLPILSTAIGSRIAYAEAIGDGTGVTVYQPQSVAANEIRALVSELEPLGASRHVATKNERAQSRAHPRAIRDKRQGVHQGG